MKLFSGIDANQFEELFRTRELCLRYLSDLKWSAGYKCRKCGNENYCHGKTPFSRRCTRCKHEESASAHTVFHNCRVPLPEAFRILYAICRNPAVSTYELSRNYELRQMTCWGMKKKILDCMEKHGKSPLLTD